MPRRRKLTDAAVRKIYTSPDTAKALSARHGVSVNMVYLIRSGRAHGRLTDGLAAPRRAQGRRASSARDVKINVKALADALLERLAARLVGRRRLKS
jgi:hypothetical protein